jgi:GNAT superfamily N-acetyltransferase
VASIPRYHAVRRLAAHDVVSVSARVVDKLAGEAARNPLVNGRFSVDELDALRGALRSATASTWVAYRGDEIVGHLYGALLENDLFGRGVWVGPDGASFDDTDVLATLYATAGQAWIDAGAREHYVWVFDERADTEPWYELGFSRMHSRGVIALEGVAPRPLPDGYALRVGTAHDLDVAVELSAEIDRAQRLGPSFALDAPTGAEREELSETLSDPDVTYYLVEHGGRGVAQCIAFPLPARRGSFDATAHLSAVAVREDHQHHGVGVALVTTVLAELAARGFAFTETNWRVTNRRAGTFWRLLGFTPTYVRLHRTVGPS